MMEHSENCHKPFWETDKKCEYGYFADLTKLPPESRFNVINGMWEGKIIEIDSRKYLFSYDNLKLSPITGNENLVIENVVLGQKRNGITNGDMFKIIFPNAEIRPIMSSFNKNKLLGYRVYLGGRSQDYLLNWWDAPYKKEIVTCKYCENYVTGALDEEICLKGHELINENFFCSDGKRKEKTNE